MFNMQSFSPRVNFSYSEISKKFMEEYTVYNASGILLTKHFYDPNSLFSLHLHKKSNYGQSEDSLYEVIGFDKFIEKLLELKISFLKCSELFGTAQPLENDMILLSCIGSIFINDKVYQVGSTIILKMKHNACSIVNHIFSVWI